MIKDENHKNEIMEYTKIKTRKAKHNKAYNRKYCVGDT